MYQPVLLLTNRNIVVQRLVYTKCEQQHTLGYILSIYDAIFVVSVLAFQHQQNNYTSLHDTKFKLIYVKVYKYLIVKLHVS